MCKTHAGIREAIAYRALGLPAIAPFSLALPKTAKNVTNAGKRVDPN
ncbi:MAG TPA: hypothetical protein IGS53_01555 [Leptolyngbyaceae cyanobacterium M33_DOE_097]|nr:hypothetical protein [Leptolyngbyaceae cyanobacterium M33_DOE_097]